MFKALISAQAAKQSGTTIVDDGRVYSIQDVDAAKGTLPMGSKLSDNCPVCKQQTMDVGMYVSFGACFSCVDHEYNRIDKQ